MTFIKGQTALKISLARKGKKHTEETKRKMSISHKGKKPYIMTDEIRKNMSLAQKGKKRSEEAKRNTNQSVSVPANNLIWNEATMTWDEADFTWDENGILQKEKKKED